jgi:hypothetical protein
MVSIDSKDIKPLTEEQKNRLRKVAELPDSEIDFSEMPRITDFSGWMTQEEIKAFRAVRKIEENPEMTEVELAKMVSWEEAKALRKAGRKQAVTA